MKVKKKDKITKKKKKTATGVWRAYNSIILLIEIGKYYRQKQQRPFAGTGRFD